MSCLSSLYLWYPFFRSPTVPAGELQPSQRALKISCLRAPKLGGGSFSLSAMYLQNRCQRNSEMFESWVLFGRYAVQTNWAKVNYKSSLTSTSLQSVHRASVTSFFASMNSLNQVGVPIRANRPMLSAPENAWSPGKAFALSGPRAAHNGSVYWTVDTMEMEVFFCSRS